MLSGENYLQRLEEDFNNDFVLLMVRPKRPLSLSLPSNEPVRRALFTRISRELLLALLLLVLVLLLLAAENTSYLVCVKRLE